jgi:signal transduction histidine kinase
MATIIWGYAALLKEGHTEKSQELGAKIFMATRRLIDEIQYQRSLIRAEQKELPLLVQEVNSLEVIKEAAEHYRYHRVASNRVIRIDEGSEGIILTSDFSLLQRVMGNLIKNALEACDDGDIVTIGCRKVKSDVEFWVHNPTFIPEDVQRQIFAQSVSTKGRGRGVGTHSVKFITEHYLKGRASFESSKEKGTTFNVSYPVKADFKPSDKSLDLGGITPQD